MRVRLKAWLPHGSFLRNAAILLSGTTFAQGLMVLSLPILTRLYPPADFNLLAVYVAILGIITVVSCLRYDIAIPLPEKDTEGVALLFVSLIAAFLISLVTALPVLLAPETIVDVLGQPGLGPYLWMIPIGVFIGSVYNALQYWATRKKRFTIVTRTRMSRAIGGVGVQLGFGATHPVPFGLLLGHMMYGGLGIFGLLRNFKRHDRALLYSLNKKNLLAQASIFRRFPLYSVPESLFNTAGVQLPLIMIAAMVTGPEAGFLFLAMRVMGLPMGLVGSSVSQVFLAEAPTKLRDGTLVVLTRNTMWGLMKAGAPVIVGIGMISPIVFPLVFGQDWARAGELVAWMTPWFVLQFVASPVSMVMHVIGRQRLAMVLQVVGMVIRVGAVLLAGAMATDSVSEMYAVSGAVFYALYILSVCWCMAYLRSDSKK